MNIIATRTMIEAAFILDHDHISEDELVELLETDPMCRETQMYNPEYVGDDTRTYGTLAWRVVFYIDAVSTDVAHQRWAEVKAEMEDRLADMRVDILALDVYTV